MSSSKKKEERRRMRYERNVRKEIEHKNRAWNDGKLIEENHNQGPYSEQYTIAVSERLFQYVNQERDRSLQTETPAEEYIRGFRKYKMKIQDMILHWNPAVPKTPQYEYLKTTLEIYWDEVVGNQDLGSLIKFAMAYDK